MKHRRSVIAVPALTLIVFAIGAADASARVPEEPAETSAVVPHDPHVREYNYPEYKLSPAEYPEPATVTVAVDDTAVEALQAGASAVGGAGLVLGTLWLYRRRHPLPGTPT
ncbi:hypothetical protein EV643_101444 [Kribbella sp. VKM Ac-2527]|uniref:MYXO-CTERM domain-containing protein n=1 Tax=Kribbella caucasensis TaxID=2512215 RepID=A0A4R6KR64_9ACTN|nr:hypothetical protein [Kribbella sp. VKM Ac-2527]TDO54654.1 hypothetical protein EV643_101444 [Kribbella sp. VKM Ac-2527]